MKLSYLFLSLVIIFFGAFNSASAVLDEPGSGAIMDRSGSGAIMDQPGNGDGSVSLKNPLAADNITELFETIIDIVLVFAVPIIVFFIIYAGFLYVTARGNESTIQKAHMALLYALIGGILILGARVLIEVVQGTVEGVTGSEVRDI